LGLFEGMADGHEKQGTDEHPAQGEGQRIGEKVSL
jgi:hypothetical protein